MKKISCMQINPKKYSCYGLQKIHTRNLITKKNSCGLKIPLPPTTFLMVRPLSFSNKLWPKFGNSWISRNGSLLFWCGNSGQRKALMRTICSREIFKKKCRQQQNFVSDPKEAWHYNHVTFTPIAKNFCYIVDWSKCYPCYMLDLWSK